MRITVDKAKICSVGSKDDAIVDALISFLCETLLLCSVGSSVHYWYRMTQTGYRSLMKELWCSCVGQSQHLGALTQASRGSPTSLAETLKLYVLHRVHLSCVSHAYVCRGKIV